MVARPSLACTTAGLQDQACSWREVILSSGLGPEIGWARGLCHILHKEMARLPGAGTVSVQ